MSKKKTTTATNHSRIFSIEDLGCPVVGYRYEGRDLAEHLMHFAQTDKYDGLPLQYLELDPLTGEFKSQLKSIIHNALNGAMSPLPDRLADQILDIAPMDLTETNGRDKRHTIGCDRFKFFFASSVNESDQYSLAREFADLADWDACLRDIQTDALADIRENEGYCTTEGAAWSPDDTDLPSNSDDKWKSLYCAANSKAAAINEPGSAAQWHMHRLDEVIRLTHEKMGWQWRGYCKAHGITEVQAWDALDFICWVLDQGIDYDEHMNAIGMVIDSFGQLRPELESNIFIPEQSSQPGTSGTTEQPAQIQTPNKTTTAMETTITRPAGWKNDPASIETVEKTHGSKFDAVLNIKTQGKTLRDFPRKWDVSADGNIITLTITEAYPDFTDTHVVKFRCKDGSRPTIRTIDDDLILDYISVPWMKKAIEGEADIMDCVTEATRRRLQKAADPSAQTPAADLPKANIKTTPIEQPAAAKPEPKAEPKPEPKPEQPAAKTPEATKPEPEPEPEAAKPEPQPAAPVQGSSPAPTPQQTAIPTIPPCYLHEGSGTYYLLFADHYIQRTSDGKFSEKIATQAAAEAAAKRNGMKVVNPIPAFFDKYLQKKPKMEIEQPATEAAKPEPKPEPKPIPEAAKPEPKPEPKPAQPAATAKPEPKPAPKPEPAPTFVLPSVITATTLKDGHMTIGGLTDLTAEQVSIFIAGMNAMREAIRQQMKMTADGMTATQDNLSF